MLAEASSAAAAAAATTGASAPGGSTDQASTTPAACSPEEVTAIDSLVSLSDEQHHAGPPDGAPPPTFPPSPPGATAPPGTATPRTPKRARGAYVSSILTARGDPAREGAARPATPSAAETAILQMALQTLSDEDLEQLCIGPGGDEADSQPVGDLSFEEMRMLPWTDTPRGRSVPERRLPHGASSTAPAALGGTHRSDAPYAQPRETLDDIARAHHSAAWHEFRAAIDATWEDFSVAHATARGTHNPNMIGDMPNAQDAASASPKLLLGARRPPPTPKAFAALGTPLPPRQAASQRGRQGAAAAATPSPPLVLAGAAPQLPPHAPTAGSEFTIDEAIKEMTRRSSPRRTHGALSTEAIDQAIAAHPRVRARSPQPATAAEARRLAAHDVAHRLTTHDSHTAN
jgi:hypothetical protein